MSVFSGSDLYTVADNLLQNAATTGDKETAKLAAQYVKLIVDHEKNEQEAERNAIQQEAEWNRFTLEQKARDREFKMGCIKLAAFCGVSLLGIGIENKYMVTSWFTKTFMQKTAPKV